MKFAVNIATMSRTLLLGAAFSVTACGSPPKVADAEPVPAVDCSGCNWREGSTVQKDDPGVGRHSLGAYEAGCYSETLQGMNTHLEPCAKSCCGK